MQDILQSTTLSQTLLSFRDVAIRMPGGERFPAISFDVKEGEHWAFVGENEALKVALLEALAGNAAMTGGRAEFPFFEQHRSAVSADPFLSPHRFIAKIADRHQFRNLSNTDQFYYQQRFNSSDSEDALTVQDYLERVHAARELPGLDLPALVDRMMLAPLLPRQLIKLSHGETKRLLMAAALLRHPRFLLMLNPFAGLDTEAKKALRETINRVTTAGITVILSTAPNEIPEAITHVARFEKDHTINTGKKEAMPLAGLPKPEKRVDETELRSLLAVGNRPAFNNIVVMKNVRIKYGDKVILDDINWTVKQGERWALLGHNGAGKSTLLSLINADNPQAFANHIILFDRKKGTGESIWDIKRKIGFFSPELYQYFPLDTSCLMAVESGFYDTIGLFRASHPELSALALQWMELLGVAHLSRKLLRQVSAVDQRLCLLARAFVKAPPLLILDEPCQGFSGEQVAAFKELVNAVCAASNTTLIYVTHNQEELPACVTKVFRLKDGRQVREGE
ncbi:MAG TPA: ATP-binding cassette domain-containing protein [Flavisolibacter sp.]|nr:ATP-binding cassette domain-containing protein [Flavisolibacter sp.]